MNLITGIRRYIFGFFIKERFKFNYLVVYMSFDFYITKNNKKLRLGYTTGTCAAIATKAACCMLFSQQLVEKIQVVTPKGMTVVSEIKNAEFSETECSCCVIKDGGDDIDATNGMEIYVKVKKVEKGITIDGGKGIGRVTKKGLDQPVGAAAINSVPRKMIAQAVIETREKYCYNGGIDVIVSAPEGEEVAKKTFNSNLGIVGGISIIGSSGIVEPQSIKAMSDAIKVEMRILSEENCERLVITPGNYGEAFLKNMMNLEDIHHIKCANFIGDVLDYAWEFNIKEVLFVGHIGKLIKTAGGIMNTHSSFGDCRMEILSAHTALFSSMPVSRIMEANTVDEGIDILDEYGLKDDVMKSIVKKIEFYLNRRTNKEVTVGAITFSNSHGLLAVGKNGEKLLEEFGGSIDV